ncbi:ATP-binding cassette domain-containing protein [Microbacterium ulmi]|uniref:ATP-binding cassette domain-containing protein n=1 Tax=Microbacterium ulmi TaxID=179095 RepID=A0A7Y2M0W1_9MICO|nr:ABC-type branched-subunit amino acid transport system ATPase component [Microbacterium ulmi]NNH03048.1 ATP-binding cassette domain-containing protein [Microbacterium ulmi]
MSASSIAAASSIPLEETALRIQGVRRAFGGVTAVDVDEIRVPRGKLTALIGPNGAGKSTLFDIITGFEAADAGTWSFEGQPLSGRRAHSIARLGLVRTFQATRIVEGESVLQNMMLAAPAQSGESLLRAAWHPGWRRGERAEAERAMALLERFRLAEKASEDAAGLSGGQRRLLEVARALMAKPRALLLDEPLAGVNPALREKVMEHLVSLRDEGLTLLFVEHDMDAVMTLSDHVVCLATGRRISEGTPAEVAGDPAVVDAYLGANKPVSAARPRTTTRDDDVVLDVRGLTAGYHPGRPIVSDIDAQVRRGEIAAIIGANGAGKSTLLKAVAGIVPVSTGTVSVDGSDMSRTSVHRRVRDGIGYVPQSRNVFPSLTVAENLRMGEYGRRHDREAIDRVLAIFPGLRDRLGARAGSLSGGQRQAVAMARALMPQPRLLLLDEPSAGLSPMAQTSAFETIADTARSGVAVLIVEQNARDCLAISHRGYVLEQGRVALTGTGHDLLHDDRVIELYLGALRTRLETDPGVPQDPTHEETR